MEATGVFVSLAEVEPASPNLSFRGFTGALIENLVASKPFLPLLPEKPHFSPA